MKQYLTGAVLASAAALTVSCTESQPNIDRITQFVQEYPTLPPKVGERALSAVSVTATFQYDPTAQGVYYEAGSGSKVNVDGKDYFLTAAHVVGKTALNCGENRVTFNSSSAPNQNLGQGKVTRQSDTEPISPEREVITPPSDYNNNLDATLLEIRNLERTPVVPGFTAKQEQVPAIPLQAKVEVQPGQSLFAINYQSLPDGQSRNMVKPNAIESSPAIYGAVVLKDIDESRFLTLTGIKSYDQVGDPNLQYEGSGGMVVDVNGNYMGMTVRAMQINATWIKADYGVDVPEGTYILGYVQKINIDQGRAMAKQLAAAQPCTDLPLPK